MFYWEFFDVSKFLQIVLNAICLQVQSERFSDNVFVSNCVAQTFVSYPNDVRKEFWQIGRWSELILVLPPFSGRSDCDVGFSVLSPSTAPQRTVTKVRGEDPILGFSSKSLYETIPNEIWAEFRCTTYVVLCAPAGPTDDKTNRLRKKNGKCKLE